MKASLIFGLQKSNWQTNQASQSSVTGAAQVSAGEAGAQFVLCGSSVFTCHSRSLSSTHTVVVDSTGLLCLLTVIRREVWRCVRVSERVVLLLIWIGWNCTKHISMKQDLLAWKSLGSAHEQLESVARDVQVWMNIEYEYYDNNEQSVYVITLTGQETKKKIS